MPMPAGEKNTVLKDRRKVALKFALAYPSPYSMGMSNLAVRLLYELINNRDDCLCERFFFTEYGQAPKSIESGMALDRFDVIGFSVQHEMDYTRMLDMILSSRIPLSASTRRHPIIIAGGPSPTSNPIPLANFVDFFVIGEVEPIVEQLLDALSACAVGKGSRENVKAIPGIFRAGAPAKRVYAENLDCAYHSVRQVHPVSGGGFSSTFLLEVSRGCSRGCRFCMECFVYRPRRERSLNAIAGILEEGLSCSGLSRVTCISSAFFDHSGLPDILSLMKSRGLRFSLPSIRITDFDDRLPSLLVSGGQKTLTIAPETPSERLRDVISKRFTNDQVFNILSKAKEAGMNSVKLYFMLGIPSETDRDIADLTPLLEKVISAGFKPGSIHISVNPMIPKSNTPFQWASMIAEGEYRSRLALFRRLCSALEVRRIEGMDYRWGAIQAYLSTGGSDASEALMRMASDIKGGGRGDLGSWRRVLKSLGKDIGAAYTAKPADAVLPWEIIKGPTPKSVLLHEFEKAIGESYGRHL